MPIVPRSVRRIAVAGLAAACALLVAAAGRTAGTAEPGMSVHRALTQARPTGRASWKIVKDLRGPDNPVFTAVTATSRHGAWAFESSATTLKPSAWRLTGSRWTRASFPGRPGEEVTSATSTSAADVWAVSTNFTRGRVLRWNGRRWAVTGSIPRALGDVVALSGRDAWVFSRFRHGTWHYNGRRWQSVPSGHGLYAGSALSPSSVWAVGGTKVAHWNGHTWSRTSVARLLPPPSRLNTPSLTSVYAQSRTSVWAIGTAGDETFGGPVALLHYNGKRWRRVALRQAQGSPGPVIPDGSGGLWIPITFYTDNFTTAMLHYTNGHLRPVALPALPRGIVLRITDLAAVPGTRQAIGTGGTNRKNGVIGGYTGAVILAYRN